MLFLPHAGSMLRPWQMCWSPLGPCMHACVCCQCHTHRSLPDHKFYLELGSYLLNSQHSLPLQIRSSRGSQRGGVSGMVTTSLSKAPVSQAITPHSKSAGRQCDPPHPPQTMAEPLPLVALRSPLRWRESGYPPYPCEWKNPPVSVGPVLDSWETLTSINTTKLFLHMAKYLCKPISSCLPLLTWRRQALSLRWIYLLSGGFQTLHIPLRHCFLLQKDVHVLEVSTWWEKGERKKREGRSEITKIIGLEASGAAAGCGVHLSVSPSSFTELMSDSDLPRAGVN